MKIEKEDIFKASYFSIKFLNYKTPKSFSTMDNFPLKFNFNLDFLHFQKYKQII